MSFEIATATKIVFGDGEASRLGQLTHALVGRAVALYVTGRDASRTQQTQGALIEAGFALRVVTVQGEPTTDHAREAVTIARQVGASVVVAVGGGSALDLGKAVAALVTHEGDPLDYLEVVGKGQPLVRDGLPFVAVPTTAGTGSEVTKNAVLADPKSRVKVSMRSDRMLPRLALVDPLLTTSVPPAVTAATGLDALTQVIEPFVSCAATPFTDGLAREGIVRGARSLRAAFGDGENRDARRDLATTSLFGGLCLANAKLGVVHGFAGPIGGAFDAPHGAICARLLPLAIETNLRAIRARGTPAMLARFDELARLLTGRADAIADDAIGFTADLARDLGIPALGTYGVRESDVGALVEKCERASSTKGNPLVLDRTELAALLTRAL
jgi:alcohol dehydrogenase class IV